MHKQPFSHLLADIAVLESELEHCLVMRSQVARELEHQRTIKGAELLEAWGHRIVDVSLEVTKRRMEYRSRILKVIECN